MSLPHASWRLRTGLLSLLAIVLCLFVLSVFLVPRNLLHSRLCALPLQGTVLSNVCSSTLPYPADPITFNGSGGSTPENHYNHSDETLGIASSIYVVSLARRTDRRQVMEQLRRALHLDWRYFDALDKNDALVDDILYSVARQRVKANETFSWPEKDIEFYPEPILSQPLYPEYVPSRNLLSKPLLCATGDNTIPTYANVSSIPFHMILSRGMIACWYSHIRLMAEIVNRTRHLQEGSWDGREGVTVVFEDDIDVEWDLKERLESMWGDLPKDWDIVLLGHCWSDESANAPLAPGSPLHPSHSPKCTHGYVLSPFGARRLLAHLAHAPFAFSRALDQALAHLVRARRIRGFSVVPSIVVQRRCAVGAGAEECEHAEGGDSDIWVSEGRRGSRWRDRLEDSALERIAKLDTDRE
ncbi:hypothetical protein DFH11DRAFT_1689199 [Phellopilus nigrolimitatus]|nr:hypothetical protein DFH11DRAFT_1689199 [Phellopilus nigrolimitatus]